MKSALLIALAAVLISAVAATTWSSCGTASDHIKITSLTFSPSNPVIGQSFSLNVAGSLDESVTSGKVSISVTYSGSVPIVDQTVDLCSIDTHNLPCPLVAGTFTKSVSQTIPAFAPAGEYTGQISAADQNGQTLFCITFDATLAASASASEPMALDDDIIAQVNKASKWVAGRNKRFEGVTLAEAKKLMGTRLAANPHYIPETTEEADSIPKAFDARQQWGNCIHPIRNQEQCGSCWAFSATEALSDRFCIASKGAIDVILSPEDMVSCDQVDQGCNGGELATAWNYLVQTGVVQDSCFPYTAGSGNAPTCPTDDTCADGKTWTKYKAAAHSVHHPTTIKAIQTAIMTSGPVQAAFTVYQDFFNYKAGVYTHQSGGEAGGHAIKIVGWGVDNGTDYWIVANSWGPDWGLDGFFWIARGADECGIEDNIYYGAPNLSVGRN